MLSPGETARQDVRLEKSSSSIFGQWWFWVGSAVLIGGVVTGALLLNKKDPEEPRRGSLGVLVEAVRR
jgi:hypothetical protein